MTDRENVHRFLDSLVNYEKIGFDEIRKEFKLGKLREALAALGGPQEKYRAIHIAGTKGKGSISTFTASILQASGYRVGLFTSPHLSVPNERIKINNEMIRDDDLARIINYLIDKLGIDTVRSFTFFEFYTLMALVHFSISDVDFAVLETGLGGRLDATNVIDAGISGLSPVSYDHMHILGNTLEKIAREKAAIIKRGAYCVSSPQRAEALKEIRSRCEAVGASLAVVGKDITCRITASDENGSAFDITGIDAEYKGCRTNMAGDFQSANCAVALGMCERALRDKGVDAKKFKEGIEAAFIPGRMEILSRGPMVVIDGAQNGDSAMRLKSSVEKIFKYDKLILVLGLSEDKDIKSVCANLAPMADEIVVTRSSVRRAADPHIIRGYIKGRQVTVTSDVKEALGTAFRLAARGDMILVTGSFYLIGEVRELVLGRARCLGNLIR
ncbi:MAG: folylpolyglutamate synthase/dihydrofolate synthase family protein [Candidatus Omnitrophota bacterium]